jgi:hypothetical protein
MIPESMNAKNGQDSKEQIKNVCTESGGTSCWQLEGLQIAECEATSGDRTMSRNIDLDPTSLMRFKETEEQSTRDWRNGKKVGRRRRGFTKRIAPILNLLAPEMIRESSTHEIMTQSGEN